MLKSITGKLDRYFPAFKRIGMEAILNDMDTRISNSEAGIVPAGSISLTELASGVQTSLGKADTALQTIASGSVVLASLAAGVTHSHVIKFANKVTWSGSGASLAITVAGVAATDVVMVTIQGAPTEAAHLVSATPTTNTVTVTLSAANTSNDAVIAYQVIRAAV